MAVKGEIEGKILVGIPKEIEKRFFTIDENHLIGRPGEIWVFKKSKTSPPVPTPHNLVIKAIEEKQKETKGIWHIKLDLNNIGKK